MSVQIKMTTAEQVTLHIAPTVPTLPPPPTEPATAAKAPSSFEQAYARTPSRPPPNPLRPEGKPQWKVVSGESEITPSEDGLSAVLVPADEPGATVVQVSVKAKVDSADSESEIDTITETFHIDVVDPNAMSLGASYSDPVPKPVEPEEPEKPEKPEKPGAGGPGSGSPGAGRLEPGKPEIKKH